MSEDAKSAQEINEVLRDGADIEVHYCDGKSEIIKVRKIAREDFSRLALLIEDESEHGERLEAALYAGRDEEWAITLAEESLSALLAEGERLNFTSFARWFRRRARLIPLMSTQKALIEAARSAMNRLGSPGSTNGSSARDIGTRSSGDTRTKS